MIIYNDDELCIICVVNYNTHARIVSIYGYIMYAFRGSVSRHENSSAIAYIIILCFAGIYRGCVVRYNNIRFWTETRSLGLHRCIVVVYTPRSIQNEIIACSLVFLPKNNDAVPTARNTEKQFC